MSGLFRKRMFVAIVPALLALSACDWLEGTYIEEQNLRETAARDGRIDATKGRPYNPDPDAIQDETIDREGRTLSRLWFRDLSEEARAEYREGYHQGYYGEIPNIAERNERRLRREGIVLEADSIIDQSGD